MRKYLPACIIIFLLITLIPSKVKAESVVSINDLIEKAKEYDGQEVTIQGEAIGEGLDRGDYSWVNINDKSNAIGIWLNTDKASKIVCYGNYKHIGDTVRITGVFHRACREHGGEADIHGTSMQIVQKGKQVKERITMGKVVYTGVLCLTAMLLFAAFIKRKGSCRINS